MEGVRLRIAYCNWEKRPKKVRNNRRLERRKFEIGYVKYVPEKG